MPCNRPLKAWYSSKVNPTGKKSLVFAVKKDGGCRRVPHDYADRALSVRCGQCLGCRLEHSRSWAVRCVHEASLHERNCFITLTFDDNNLRPTGSLDKADFPKFMKRLRKRFFGNGKSEVRYFHCGEYGEKFKRPHHHACLFGFDFPDKELWSVRDNVKLYRSRVLEELWPFGFCTIGDVTFESAAYVARYVTKKITGSQARDHYGTLVPEYLTMSRRPAIGRGWIDKFKKDVYPDDFLVIRGNKKCKPARYYDRRFEVTDPAGYALIKEARKSKMVASDDDWRKLLSRRIVQDAKGSQLKRGYENGA